METAAVFKTNRMEAESPELFARGRTNTLQVEKKKTFQQFLSQLLTENSKSVHQGS